MTYLNTNIWPCRYLCRMDKTSVFRTLTFPSLLCGCKTCILNRSLKKRIYAFSNVLQDHDASPHLSLFKPVCDPVKASYLHCNTGETHSGCMGMWHSTCSPGCFSKNRELVGEGQRGVHEARGENSTDPAVRCLAWEMCLTGGWLGKSTRNGKGGWGEVTQWRAPMVHGSYQWHIQRCDTVYPYCILHNIRTSVCSHVYVQKTKSILLSYS